jgi:flagellar protein FliO/FliZ
MNALARAASGVLATLACAPALAALPTVAAPVPVATSGGGLLQASAGMILVLGLIFLLAWLARRFGLQRLGGSTVVKVVTSAPVGSRERVVVVEVAGTWLVLGVTPSHVNTLHTLPAQPTPATAAGGDAARNALALFSGKLREAVGAREPRT